MDLHFDLTQTQRVSVMVAAGIEARLPALVQSMAPDGVVVVYDTALEDLAKRIGDGLGARTMLPVHEGEAAKQLSVVGKLAEQLHVAAATRATVMVAVGGGTLTDLAGFVASIYLRGIPFVSCPTTTLAMCDAALGGKNGVDHCGLKNRLGTIRQPDAIVMDTDWLQTLPDEMFREGIVEVVKKAAVLDAARFAELEALAPALLNRDTAATSKTIAMAVDMKMQVVVEDEREGDRRRALNAGHTIGHAIESLAAGSVRHGHAVAMGMIAECRAAKVDEALTTRIADLLQAIGVDTNTPAHLRDAAKLWDLARQDKKAMRGQVPMYVPVELGKGAIVDLTPESLADAMQNDGDPRTTS
ncbi:MAG: 3-dehydroquinate synthase [Planctomycetota bacterium]|jgi:3-dehydroquinate synthase